MASVNKASLREEFATLKERFEQHCSEGQVSAELRALFEALPMLFELLMAVFMEKNTTKTCRSSGLPPSHTGQDEDPITPERRTRAKGQNHTHNRSNNTRAIETVTTIAVKHCTQVRPSRWPGPGAAAAYRSRTPGSGS